MAAAFAGYADLPGVRLWYTDSGGDGVPIVLMHANTGNADFFERNTPGLAAAGYRAIAFDRRGWGRSMANPDTGPQPGTKGDDLSALVDYLQLDRFHLFGIAGGGFVGYVYAFWHPERLRSLMVGASGGAGALADPEFNELRRKTALPGMRTWPAHFREVSPGFMAEHPEELERWLEIHSNGRQEGAPTQPLGEEITFEKLATLKVPTLLMPGDQDLTTPPWVMRRQAANIPGCEFVVFPEGAHAMNYEYPDAFNRQLLEFVGRH